MLLVSTCGAIRALALASLCFLILPELTTCQTFSPLALTGAQDPLPLLRQLANLPQKQQRLYLMLIGEGIKARQALSCNPFGGASDCVTLPVTTAYADACGITEAKVDCIYHQEDAVDLTEDVLSGIGERDVQDLQDSCPTCLNNIKRFHCLQTTPGCGTFQTRVESSILPALVAVDTARNSGKMGISALAAAVPVLLNTSALTMPCREMCEAVISTCSCSRDYSFGSLLEAWNARRSQESPGMSSSFAAIVFSQIYNRPLCSVFASSSEPAFAGPCEALPLVCEDADRWCKREKGKTDGRMVVQELIAAQLATMLTGFTGSLFADQEEMIEDSKSDKSAAWEQEYLAATGKTRDKSSHTHFLLIAIAILVCLALAGAGAYATYYHRCVTACRERGAPKNGYIALGVDVGRDSA